MSRGYRKAPRRQRKLLGMRYHRVASPRRFLRHGVDHGGQQEDAQHHRHGGNGVPGELRQEHHYHAHQDGRRQSGQEQDAHHLPDGEVCREQMGEQGGYVRPLQPVDQAQHPQVGQQEQGGEPHPTVTPRQELGGVGLTPGQSGRRGSAGRSAAGVPGEKGAKTTARKRISRKTITSIPWAAVCQPSW